MTESTLDVFAYQVRCECAKFGGDYTREEILDISVINVAKRLPYMFSRVVGNLGEIQPLSVGDINKRLNGNKHLH